MTGEMTFNGGGSQVQTMTEVAAWLQDNAMDYFDRIDQPDEYTVSCWLGETAALTISSVGDSSKSIEVTVRLQNGLSRVLTYSNTSLANRPRLRKAVRTAYGMAFGFEHLVVDGAFSPAEYSVFVTRSAAGKTAVAMIETAGQLSTAFTNTSIRRFYAVLPETDIEINPAIASGSYGAKMDNVLMQTVPIVVPDSGDYLPHLYVTLRTPLFGVYRTKIAETDLVILHVFALEDVLE